MSKYFIITASDGEPDLEILTKDELEIRLGEEFEDYMYEHFCSEGDLSFLSEGGDLTYLNNSYVILIKGDIIIPKKKEVVTQYEID